MKRRVKRGFVLLCVLLMCSGITAYAKKATNSTYGKRSIEELATFRPTINNRYSFNLKNAMNVAICNRETTSSDVIYMEYEVGKVEEDTTNQTRLLATANLDGFNLGVSGQSQMYYESHKRGDGSPMLVSGAKYYICFAKRDKGFEIFALRTHEKKNEVVVFSDLRGTWDDAYKYFTLFFGESRGPAVTCEFKNFKCYDGYGKDLGIQMNTDHSNVEIIHNGPLSAKEVVWATYYCVENPERGVIVLGENRKGYVENKDGKTEFTYEVHEKEKESTTLYMTFPDGKEIYDYHYVQVVDASGNSYKRLKDTTVTFVTEEGRVKKTATAETGYRVEKPEDPKKKGAKFVGWYLGNDEAFDFHSIVAESITLYAKWEGPDGRQYLAVGSEVKVQDYSLMISLAVCTLTIAAGIAGSILIVRRKKNGKV